MKTNARSIKVLLILLRDRIKNKKELCTGLCNEATFLINDGLIFFKECDRLHDYFNIHRPKRGKHFDKYWAGHSYFCELTLVEPRLDWLNYRIKKERY